MSAVSPADVDFRLLDLRMLRTTLQMLPVQSVIGSVIGAGADRQTKCFMCRNRFLEMTYMSKHRDTSLKDSVAIRTYIMLDRRTVQLFSTSKLTPLITRSLVRVSGAYGFAFFRCVQHICALLKVRLQPLGIIIWGDHCLFSHFCYSYVVHWVMCRLDTWYMCKRLGT